MIVSWLLLAILNENLLEIAVILLTSKFDTVPADMFGSMIFFVMILFVTYIQGAVYFASQDLPFIQNMRTRISSADGSVDAALRRCFVGALERRDETVILHCLRAYAAIDNSAGAEEAFQSAVVAPFVQRIVFSQPVGITVASRSDRLEEVLEEIKVQVQTDCRFLLDKAASGSDYLLLWMPLCVDNYVIVTSY